MAEPQGSGSDWGWWQGLAVRAEPRSGGGAQGSVQGWWQSTGDGGRTLRVVAEAFETMVESRDGGRALG